MFLICFAYHETECSRINLEYFVSCGGILPQHDYIFVVNGPSTFNFPSLSNVRVLHRANVGFDFGGHRAALDAVSLSDYDFFVFLNGSVIGPISHWGEEWDWVRFFHSRFCRDASVRLLGTTIVCLPKKDSGGFGPKVEGFFWCTDSLGIQLLLQEGTILCDHPDKTSAIIKGEYGLSNCLLGKHGFNLACMLSRYQGINWRDPTQWHHNNNQHPSRHKSYYGESINPYEVIFHKWRWAYDAFVNKEVLFTHIRNIRPNAILQKAIEHLTPEHG